MSESMAMLPEPSLPPQPAQLKPNALPRQATRPDINLAQGRSTLSTYIQTAASQYEETPPAAEEQFVTAFTNGLRDKRNRKKCEKRFKDVEKTWGNLIDCFPVASQQSQSLGQRKQDKRMRVVDKKEEKPKKIVEKMERRRDAATTPPPPLPLVKQSTQTGKENRHRPTLDLDSARQVKRDLQTAHPPPSPVMVQKRTLAEQGAGQKREESRGGEPPAAKKRKTKKVVRRQGRPPTIPILPSSDDEFSRGGRTARGR
jgi:hypothetical protein